MIKQIKGVNLLKLRDIELLIGEKQLKILLNDKFINQILEIHPIMQFGVHPFTKEKISYLMTAIYTVDNFHGNAWYLYGNGVFLYKIIDDKDKTTLFLKDLYNGQLHTEENYYKKYKKI